MRRVSPLELQLNQHVVQGHELLVLLLLLHLRSEVFEVHRLTENVVDDLELRLRLV